MLKMCAASNLLAGRSQSCRCLRSEQLAQRSRTHGSSNSREYRIFLDAKRRCENPDRKDYKDYGGRGIQFRFKSFLEFSACLGPRPAGFTLDRIDNDGHYEADNVRWATRLQQRMNQRAAGAK